MLSDEIVHGLPATQGPLAGKVALVSGGGRGIGRAIALKLASSGASIVLNDRDSGPADDVAHAIHETGGRVAVCAGDVLASDFGDRFVKTAIDAFGEIDIIVNNAGFAWDSVVQKTSDEQWEAMIGIHLTAPFRILRAAQPVISAAAKREIADRGRAQRRSVVNISSIAGLGGNAGQAGYASGKAGIVGLTRTLSKEWGRYGVTVNAVAFGVIATRMTTQAGEGPVEVGDRQIKMGMSPELAEAAERAIPLGRVGTPEDAAGAVYILCLPEAEYISGEVITCGGGYRF